MSQYACCSLYRFLIEVVAVIALLTGLWSFTPSIMAQPALSVTPEGEMYNVAPYMQVYEDKTKRLTFADIHRHDFLGFSALGSISFNKGYTQSAYWLRFRIVTASKHPFDWLLEIGYPNLHRLDLYILRTGRNLVVKKGGAIEPFERREFTSPSFVFVLDDSACSTISVPTLPDTLTCYLRVETGSSMIVPVTLYAPRVFDRHSIVQYLLYGLLYGVMVAMAYYNLFLAVSVRERFYLYYVFYVLAFVLADIAITGLGAVFTQSVQIIWMRLLPFFMPLSSLCATLFARNFLHPAEYSPRADKVLRGVAVVHVVVLVLTFVVPYSVIIPFIAMMIGVVCTILISVGIISLRSGYRPARFFLAGWIVFLTAAIMRSFSTVGVTPFTWWAEHVPLVGAALETLLLSLALADRINLLKRRQAEALERAVEQRTAELKDTNTALEEANHFKTQMLSIAAHDLKNPLSAIMGLAEVASFDLAPDHEIRPLLFQIQAVADRMVKLIRDLLDSAAIELGSMTLKCQTMSLSLLLVGIVSRYFFPAEQKRQTITVEIEDDVMVFADADRLEQVFDNLLSNAVKYSLLGTTITVRLLVQQATARVEIQDAGPGMSADDKAKLFRMFQPLSATPTGGESNSGVGLAITKKIVDLHKGQIWVESELGRGATFVVELTMGHL